MSSVPRDGRQEIVEDAREVLLQVVYRLENSQASSQHASANSSDFCSSFCAVSTEPLCVSKHSSGLALILSSQTSCEPSSTPSPQGSVEIKHTSAESEFDLDVAQSALVASDKAATAITLNTSLPATESSFRSSLLKRANERLTPPNLLFKKSLPSIASDKQCRTVFLVGPDTTSAFTTTNVTAAGVITTHDSKTFPSTTSASALRRSNSDSWLKRHHLNFEFGNAAATVKRTKSRTSKVKKKKKRRVLDKMKTLFRISSPCDQLSASNSPTKITSLPSTEIDFKTSDAKHELNNDYICEVSSSGPSSQETALKSLSACTSLSVFPTTCFSKKEKSVKNKSTSSTGLFTALRRPKPCLRLRLPGQLKTTTAHTSDAGTCGGDITTSSDGHQDSKAVVFDTTANSSGLQQAVNDSVCNKENVLLTLGVDYMKTEPTGSARQDNFGHLPFVQVSVQPPTSPSSVEFADVTNEMEKNIENCLSPSQEIRLGLGTLNLGPELTSIGSISCREDNLRRQHLACIASKIAHVGDAYLMDHAIAVQDQIGEVASCSQLNTTQLQPAMTLERMTSWERDLISWVRSTGDSLHNTMPAEVVSELMHVTSAEAFRSVMIGAVSSLPEAGQLTAVFSLTSLAIRALGASTSAGSTLLDNCAEFIGDRFANWIIGRGGWASAMETDTDEDAVDKGRLHEF